MSLKINDSTLGPRTEIFQKDYNLLLPIFRGAILISFELYLQLRNFSKSCLSGTFKQMFLFSYSFFLREAIFSIGTLLYKGRY